MTLGAFLLIAQATTVAATAASEPTTTPQPDIEIKAHMSAREVSIEQDGPIKVLIRPEPLSSIEVKRSQPGGARSYRNLTIDVRLAARLSQDEDGTLTVQTESSTGKPPQ